jgi:peptidoglycan hydrolase-like protein with peptidoglycan-binding domain
MVRNKYFVVFDEMEADRPVKFTQLYQILDNTLVTSPGNLGEFSYTKTRTSARLQLDYPRYSYYSPTPVEVFVSQIAHTDDGQLEVDYRKGATDLSTNPINNQIIGDIAKRTQYCYLPNVLDEGNCPDPRKNSVWVSNKNLQNKFHFMTVIYPRKPGTTAPTIERIDDYTAKITGPNGELDIVSFNNNPQSTIAVDLANLTPLPVPDGGYGTVIQTPIPPPTIAVNGSCGTTVNICNSGTLNDTTDTNANYLWSCIGSNGGTTASCSLDKNIAPDTTPPTISITSPSNNQTVRNSVTLSATSSDNIGVIGVQFKLDGANVGQELTTAPYSGTWNTAGVSNGSHTLTAVARDLAGNTKTSILVTITVSNTTPVVTSPITTPNANTPATPPTGIFTPTVPQLPPVTTSNNCTPTYATSTLPSLPTFTPALIYGSRGANVLTLQNHLIKYNYLAKGLNTGYYGPLTQTAITKYNTARNTKVQTNTCPINQQPLTNYQFTRNLTIGSTGNDVKQLQIFLNARGYTVSTSGAGSKGNETTYFGPATQRAVASYQRANGINPPAGYFGPTTRAFVNKAK